MDQNNPSTITDCPLLVTKPFYKDGTSSLGPWFEPKSADYISASFSFWGRSVSDSWLSDNIHFIFKLFEITS